MSRVKKTALYQRVWRWHFFAGIMVVPFAIVLAITGCIYVFNPQITSFSEARLDQRAVIPAGERHALSADSLLAGLSQQYPQAVFKNLTLARADDHNIEFELDHAGTVRTHWLNQYNGDILAEQDKEWQFLEIVKDIHGNLFAGNTGSYVVELVASWMIVMIISGIYLSLASQKVSLGRAFKQALFPRLREVGQRQFWRNLHSALGLWIGAIVLIFLLSGLPWTQLWGNGFKNVQAAMGWNGPGQEWMVTLRSGGLAALPSDIDHGDHHHEGSHSDGELWQISPDDEVNVTLESRDLNNSTRTAVTLQTIVQKTQSMNLQHPIKIQAPKNETGVWTVRSLTPNRPLRTTIHYDKWSGRELMRINFSDHHLVKRVASYGIAFHEGALFGWLNQAIAVLAALSVITLSVSGIIMWWRRRPTGQFAAPAKPADSKLQAGVGMIILSLAIFLPMLAISLILLLMLDLLTRLLRTTQVASEPG